MKEESKEKKRGEKRGEKMGKRKKGGGGGGCWVLKRSTERERATGSKEER